MRAGRNQGSFSRDVMLPQSLHESLFYSTNPFLDKSRRPFVTTLGWKDSLKHMIGAGESLASV